MLTCHCPRCDEEFSLPTAAVPADATAQCPWCSELYPASEIIDKLPPMVALIAADGQPLFLETESGVAQGSLAATAVGAPETESPSWGEQAELTMEAAGEPGLGPDAGLADAGLAGDNTMDFLHSDAGTATDFRDDSDVQDWGAASLGEASAAEDSGDAAPLMLMKVRSVPSSNRRRKKSSPLKTLIGVAMGPLVALPLAGGILLWLGKAPDLGFWP
ncbi:MAG: hypothetical protein ACF788_11440, partial [Novipirellula sp. JB048]